ncbi:MAG: penicillin-binding protein 2 [Clostridia bacterium]|nr:penicillin-binding protein 2 [Clostridia bacterium]
MQNRADRRLRLFQIVSALVLVLLLARLWQLQVIQGDYYSKKATNNRLALLPISAPRGPIVDRRGEVLATSRMAYTISAMPLEFLDRDGEVRLLSELLGISVQDIEAKIAGQTEGRYGIPYQPARLMEDAPPEVVVRVSEHQVDLPGVIIEDEPYRSYPKGSVAGQLIGYVGQISLEELQQLGSKGYRGRDRIGKAGLEREFEDQLRGKDGAIEVEVDSLARPVGTMGKEPAASGATLVLTIDSAVQRAAEEALRAQLATLRAGKYKNARAGAAVAIDARTGEVIALASEPGYDPGWFVPRISDQHWQQVSGTVSALFNRAISGAYPPGSVFKPFTAAAALEAGVVSLTEKFLCSPSESQHYYGMRCSVWSKGTSHGRQNLFQGMVNSCNIVFYELGRRLTADQMAAMARQFGLSYPTGSKNLPPGSSGSVPDSSVRTFMPGERLSYAIGQQVTVTPLQMAAAYAGIAMRGPVPRPYVVRQVLGADGAVQEAFSPTVERTAALSTRTWDYLHASLLEVTRTGTAAWAFRGFATPVAGKTGTAQAPPGDPHGWFVGWAPADKPEIVVAVMIERGGGGGTAAAPVARAIFEAYEASFHPAAAETGTSAAPGAADGGVTPGASNASRPPDGVVD